MRTENVIATSIMYIKFGLTLAAGCLDLLAQFWVRQVPCKRFCLTLRKFVYLYICVTNFRSFLQDTVFLETTSDGLICLFALLPKTCSAYHVVHIQVMLCICLGLFSQWPVLTHLGHFLEFFLTCCSNSWALFGPEAEFDSCQVRVVLLVFI